MKKSPPSIVIRAATIDTVVDSMARSVALSGLHLLCEIPVYMGFNHVHGNTNQLQQERERQSGGQFGGRQRYPSGNARIRLKPTQRSVAYDAINAAVSGNTSLIVEYCVSEQAFLVLHSLGSAVLKGSGLRAVSSHCSTNSSTRDYTEPSSNITVCSCKGNTPKGVLGTLHHVAKPIHDVVPKFTVGLAFHAIDVRAARPHLIAAR